MKKIDAHLHLFPPSRWADKMARMAGHENSAGHLLAYYRQHDFVHGIVMGNEDLRLESYQALPPELSFCVGLDTHVMQGGLPKDAPAIVEAFFQRPQCVGIKLYPGYSPVYVYDPVFKPFLELAQQYGKVVAVHTGATAASRAKLRYAHPLALDEVAADWPGVTFVMCHMGNPFLAEAAAVLEKNANVFADLSAFVYGPFEPEVSLCEQAGFVALLQTWLHYVDDWSKFLFGTDWPAVNLGAYEAWIQRVVPEEHWEKVFFQNADRVYRLGL